MFSLAPACPFLCFPFFWSERGVCDARLSSPFAFLPSALLPGMQAAGITNSSAQLTTMFKRWLKVDCAADAPFHHVFQTSDPLTERYGLRAVTSHVAAGNSTLSPFW